MVRPAWDAQKDCDGAAPRDRSSPHDTYRALPSVVGEKFEFNRRFTSRVEAIANVSSATPALSRVKALNLAANGS